MTKANIEKLIDLERAHVDGSLADDQSLIDLGRLRQEFDMWDPQRLDRWAEEHKKRVEEAWKQVPPTHDVFPTGVAVGCTCGKPLWMVPPYPPCPVHGPSPTFKVTC